MFLFFLGSAKPGQAPVPLQRPPPDRQGSLRRQLQAKGEGPSIRDLAVPERDGGGLRSPQVEGHLIPHRMAHYQRRCHLQVSILFDSFYFASLGFNNICNL